MRLERGEIALGQKLEMGHQRGHGRDRSDRGAAAVCARHSARSRAKSPAGSKLRQPASTRSTSSTADAQPQGGLGRVDGQIAGLVEAVGQVAAIGPVGRVGEGEGDLLFDMVAQRDGRRRELVEVERLGRGAAAVAGCRLPLRRQVRPDPLRRAGVVGEHVFEPGIELGRDRLDDQGAILAGPVRIGGFGFRSLSAFAGIGLRGSESSSAAALQKRVALDLFLDEVLQLAMGQLQQLDRLHELRRHHQRLRLPQSAAWPITPSDLSPTPGASPARRRHHVAQPHQIKQLCTIPSRKPVPALGIAPRHPPAAEPGSDNRPYSTGPALACQGDRIDRRHYRGVMLRSRMRAYRVRA